MNNLHINLDKLDELKNEELVLNQEKSKEMTGYASIDKPWMKWYPKEALTDTIPLKTMWEVIKENTLKYHDLVALTYQDTDIKYSEMIQEIERMATCLTNYGIKKGDCVSLCLPNMPECVYLFYAINKIGAIVNPIDPRTNAERIKYYLTDSNSKIMFMLDLCYQNIEKIDSQVLKTVVTIPANRSIGNKVIKSLYDLKHKKIKTGGRYINIDDFIKKYDNNQKVADVSYEKDKTVVIMHTSGTTGVPKGVELRNESYNGQNMQIKYSGIDPVKGETFLGNIPIFSAYGSSSGMHNAITNGVRVVLIPANKPEDLPKLLLKYRPQHIMGTPRDFERLMHDKKAQKSDLSFVKNFVCGGNTIPVEREIAFNEFSKKHNGPPLKKGLGRTEDAGGTITTGNYNNKIGSVGIPHVGNNIKIVDINTKQELKYNEIGELYVNSITRANGYLNNEQENKEHYITDEEGRHWAITGDLAKVDIDGVVFFMGRIKRSIMRPDGLTVSLIPIENAICKSKNVNECVVVGIDSSSQYTGTLPMAFISLNDGVSLKEVQEEIDLLCEKYLPERERPAWFRYISNIPYTKMSKPDSIALEKYGYQVGELDKKVLDLREKQTENNFVKKLKK